MSDKYHYEDYHTHNLLCHHAIGTLEDYVKQAIKLNLTSIGLSDHFPYEFLKKIETIPYKEYSMTLQELEGYVSLAESLKKKYKSQINVKIGFEIDYVEEQEDILNNHLKKFIKRLDYIIGSVHIVFGDHGAWCFDDTKFLKEYDYNGVDNVYLQYFKLIRNMLNSNKFSFDIIGHFDLPKKFRKFPENKDLILKEAIKTIELVKKKNKAIEINTSGLRKDVKEQYPSEELIKIMCEKEIPIVLGSDAHDPKEVAYEFQKVLLNLKKYGCNNLASFEKRNRNFIKI